MERILDLEEVRAVAETTGRGLLVTLVRRDLDATRKLVRAGKCDVSEVERRYAGGAVARRLAKAADAILTPRPRPVIHAGGVVVHTNLGRSLLSADAAARVAESARGYMDLEFDLDRGRRGSRSDHLAPLMDVLFPGHDFVVVNNNAAAILLALRALARRRDVVVSRGELVEIGGSFRVPDILAASGARLHEVGTTNRTRLADYESAVGPKTGALLKVHTSNFRIVGFTEDTTIPDLAELSRRTGVPLVVDWGSGDMVDLAPMGIEDEIPVGSILDAGAGVVTFSGDKLLGGPQAGIAVGHADLIRKMRKDPMARVCRLDRLMISALHATLSAYVRGTATRDVPTLAMIALGPERIAERARAVAAALAERAGDAVATSLRDDVSRIGGGSSPGGERPTVVLDLVPTKRPAHRVVRALRQGAPAVVARLQDDRVVLDLRTVLPEQDAVLIDRLVEVLTARR